MAALEWFESIADLRAKADKLRDEIATAYAAAGVHGQQMGSIGGGAKHDALAGIDSLIDSDAQSRLSKMDSDLIGLTNRALDVLYGDSGRGGVAKMVGTDEADILCYRYLIGESWATVARRYEPDTSNLTMWCKCRARQTCRQIDRIGMDALADS